MYIYIYIYIYIYKNVFSYLFINSLVYLFRYMYIPVAAPPPPSSTTARPAHTPTPRGGAFAYRRSGAPRGIPAVDRGCAARQEADVHLVEDVCKVSLYKILG